MGEEVYRDRVAVARNSMKLNGTDNPLLLFKGILCHDSLDPDRTHVFWFHLRAQRTKTCL